MPLSVSGKRSKLELRLNLFLPLKLLITLAMEFAHWLHSSQFNNHQSRLVQYVAGVLAVRNIWEHFEITHRLCCGKSHAFLTRGIGVIS